jgi:hypothetical protein
MKRAVMATTTLDKLRAALPYSSGEARREIARQIAEASAPKRWCLWCGADLPPSLAGEFCDETCAAEDAAAPR